MANRYYTSKGIAVMDIHKELKQQKDLGLLKKDTNNPHEIWNVSPEYLYDPEITILNNSLEYDLRNYTGNPKMARYKS